MAKEFGEGPRSQGMAVQLVSEKKSGGNFLGDLNEEKVERKDRVISNSSFALDGNLERNSGDGILIRRDKLESGKGPSGINGNGVGGSSSLSQFGLNFTGVKGIGSESLTNASSVEKCIEQTRVVAAVCKKSGGNGRRVGQWKKAARKNLGEVVIPSQETTCGKRKEVVTVESFTNGNKKPKHDSPLSVTTVLSAGQKLLAR
ncbi:hypothetical protein LWI28_000111 [Acer negundo]|uniref:Uncharacterized protein n=1 Tax=Acer negundo TaxID=4023 RepID=A0AAD5JNQ7_ACENE|nr:hypothetical protein LWI28_000111 [Acer negundo]